MAEVHTNEVNIDENNYLFYGEVELEQAGDVMVQAGDVMEEAGDIEHGGNVEYAGDIGYARDVGHTGDIWEQSGQESFAIMPSTIVLWDYAQEIVQDDMEHRQTHPHDPHRAHPPIQMLHRDKCLLALMVEDRREVVFQLWQELDEIEYLLGLEHI
ncbi:uncharacterized protein EDB91DRAFT_1085992 [Suillus paluster]|uniref:uncharacterized protein n=1 Tax=Suillus paluster TaxID=48578 RepID=UPI001B87C092|nr:uncharacterized protein EDB91DRAFT_1085992 [Suillus paluster]KAG1728751.1 hypothetical protein EDB91DRAFT_1085992 [Suillus paluster]